MYNKIKFQATITFEMSIKLKATVVFEIIIPKNNRLSSLLLIFLDLLF